MNAWSPEIKYNINHSLRLPLTSIMQIAFNNILHNKHTIDESITGMEGFSGYAYRNFINLLVKRIPDPRYLELGLWKGSTFCSAVWKNNVTAVGIDNWSEFGGPRNEFHANLAKVNSDTTRIQIIEEDFHSVDFTSIGKFNIYMFDGPVSEQETYEGITNALPALENDFILIIDDWNWSIIRKGTLRAIREHNLIVDSITVTTGSDTEGPGQQYQYSPWHNGYYIASVRKNS
jgi:hypothetical protein